MSSTCFSMCVYVCMYVYTSVCLCGWKSGCRLDNWYKLFTSSSKRGVTRLRRDRWASAVGHWGPAVNHCAIVRALRTSNRRKHKGHFNTAKYSFNWSVSAASMQSYGRMSTQNARRAWWMRGLLLSMKITFGEKHPSRLIITPEIVLEVKVFHPWRGDWT